jgi:hypothetical protein
MVRRQTQNSTDSAPNERLNINRFWYPGRKNRS